MGHETVKLGSYSIKRKVQGSLRFIIKWNCEIVKLAYIFDAYGIPTNNNTKRRNKKKKKTFLLNDDWNHNHWIPHNSAMLEFALPNKRHIIIHKLI